MRYTVINQPPPPRLSGVGFECRDAIRRGKSGFQFKRRGAWRRLGLVGKGRNGQGRSAEGPTHLFVVFCGGSFDGPHCTEHTMTVLDL